MRALVLGLVLASSAAVAGDLHARSMPGPPSASASMPNFVLAVGPEL